MKNTPQKRTSKLLTISMSKDIKIQFNEFCDEQNINKSKLISWLIQEYLNLIKK